MYQILNRSTLVCERHVRCSSTIDHLFAIKVNNNDNFEEVVVLPAACDETAIAGDAPPFSRYIR